MSDSIPSADAAFDDLQKHFVATVTPDPTKYGLMAGDVTDLKASQAIWDPALQNSKDADLAAKAATQTKKDARAGHERNIRSKIAKVNAMPGVTNATRAALGLPAHAETAAKISPPETRPVGRIVDRGAHRQEAHWVDEMTPLSRAKPHHVSCCELFLKIGDPAPVDETTCVRIAEDTASPYLYEFDVADVGKTAHWLLRWKNIHNETGPFSLVVSAKINS